jgi:DNA polymerase-3 subunit gamma/tau
MSYQVLARKWRPYSFDSLIGQSHVVRALKNALDQQRLHHAYLFTGTRGVGKTTLGRILAKCLNCEQGISSEPCNTCAACQEIAAGHFIDLIEVDAASRTKVEDTRDLLENVPYAPTNGRFKVYLIDEAHMLSTHSFNALLKTLEEPPPHVKFFLATTDPQKIPITVLSRCLQFHLKCLSQEQITQHLAYVLQQEKIEYEEAALLRLAHAAEGSMRDALSLLDQAIAFGQGKIQIADVKLMLSTIEADYIYQIIDALANQQADKLIIVTQQLAEMSSDFKNVLEEILSCLHQVALAQFIKDIEVNYWDKEKILAYAEQFSPEDVQLFYQIALIGRKDLPLAPTPRIGLEIVLLRMLAFKPAKISQPLQPTNLAQVKQHEEKTENIQRESSSDANSWQDILSKLKLTGMVAAIANNCMLKKISEDEIVLALDPAQAILLNQKQQERLSQALQIYFNKPIRLTIENGHGQMDTPAFRDQQEKNKRKSEAKESIESDLNVKKLIEQFNATLIPDSIEVDG